MGKYDRIVDIQKSPKTINNWRLATEELEERFKSLHRTVSYLAAKEAHENLLSSIPSGSEYADLRKALKISEIGTKSGGAYSVHAPVKGRRIRKIDVPKTIIYVRAKKKMTRADPAVQLLAEIHGLADVTHVQLEVHAEQHLRPLGGLDKLVRQVELGQIEDGLGL